jgi:hypothetical protein
MARLRVLVCRASIWGLFGLGVLLLFSQWTELQAHTESVPLGSTVTFLALSGLAFNWGRFDDSIVEPQEKRVAKQAGVDLFAASMVALVTQGLVWASPIFTKLSSPLGDLVLIVHTSLLGLSILVAWLPIRRLLLVSCGHPSALR